MLDNISSPANLGSIFRLADAFNIQKLVLCGEPVDLDSNRLKRTARSTVKNVEYEQCDDAVEFCRERKAEGYALCALEITRDSIALDSIEYSGFSKMVLILGNENSGIDEKILQLSVRKIHIEMFGKNSSMNVAQAAGIALFEITKSLPPVSNK